MPVIDHLEQALKSGGDASSLREGVELILRDLLGSLAKLGLVIHDPVGQLFDPLRDQALAHEEVAGVEDGTVLETYRRGHLLRDRLLRPALVKVAKAEAETQGKASDRGDPAATAGAGGPGPSAGGQEEVH
jgi:molecular chaperone GrpE